MDCRGPRVGLGRLTNEWCSWSALPREEAELTERVHLGWPVALEVQLRKELELADLRVVLAEWLQTGGYHLLGPDLPSGPHEGLRKRLGLCGSALSGAAPS